MRATSVVPSILLTALLTGAPVSPVVPATGAPPTASEATGVPAVTAVADGNASGTDPVGTWPLRPAPQVVHRFDPPLTPWGAGHRGVDLLARPGQVVRAALPGTVTYAAQLAGRGVVVVSHGATRTTYEPVEATVLTGTTVRAGDRLGTVQPAPSHCAPQACLHWGWVEGETYLDPLRLVGQGPIRLLPYLSDGAGAAASTDPGATGRAIHGTTSRAMMAGLMTRLMTGPPAGPPVPPWW